MNEKDPNRVRANIRDSSQLGPNIKVSLQTCKVNENYAILEELYDSKRKNKTIYRGLQSILDELLTQVYRYGRYHLKSFMTFTEAYELYQGYQESLPQMRKESHKVFRDNLLHPVHGLCVSIIYIPKLGKRLVLLRPDDMDLAALFQWVEHEYEEYHGVSTVSIDKFQIFFYKQWILNGTVKLQLY